MSKRRDDLIDRLERLSQKVDIPIWELAEMASIIASKQIDPIEATGAPFLFQNRRPNCEAILLDPLWINEEVPAPDADVDLIDAFEEWKRDAERAAEVLEGKPPLAKVLAIHQNHRDWFRFWAVRCPVAEAREVFARCLAEREAAMARLLERANP